MSIQTEINRIKLNINNALDLVASYGVQIEATDTSNELPTRIALIAEALEGFIKYTQLTLTEALKTLARTNIGAASKSDIPIIPTNISAFNNDAGYLTLHLDISGKLDAISDLATIRRGAALGASALLSYTETDPTVPLYIKDATTSTSLATTLSTKNELTAGIFNDTGKAKSNINVLDLTPGIWYCSTGCTNTPENKNYCVIIVFSDWTKIALCYNDNSMYYRAGGASDWTRCDNFGYNTLTDLLNAIGTNLYGATTASGLASVVVDNISDISLVTLRDKLKAIW